MSKTKLGVTLRSMPSAVLVLFGLFAILPFWSLSFLTTPWPGALAATVYWIAPVVLCLLIMRRSFLFLPCFLLECLGAVLHAASQAPDGPSGASVTRIVLLVVSAAASVLFLNKDFYFPFLAPVARFWRRSARIPAQTLVRIGTDESPRGIDVMIEDCSLTGIALAGDPERLDPYLASKPKGERIALSLGSGMPELNGRIAWKHQMGAMTRLGLSFDDPSTVAPLLARLSGAGTSSFKLAWARSSLRRGMGAIWLACSVSSYLTPACGTALSGLASEGNDVANAGGESCTESSSRETPDPNAADSNYGVAEYAPDQAGDPTAVPQGFVDGSLEDPLQGMETNPWGNLDAWGNPVPVLFDMEPVHFSPNPFYDEQNNLIVDQPVTGPYGYDDPYQSPPEQEPYYEPAPEDPEMYLQQPRLLDKPPLSGTDPNNIQRASYWVVQRPIDDWYGGALGRLNDEWNHQGVVMQVEFKDQPGKSYFYGLSGRTMYKDLELAEKLASDYDSHSSIRRPEGKWVSRMELPPDIAPETAAKFEAEYAKLQAQEKSGERVYDKLPGSALGQCKFNCITLAREANQTMNQLIKDRENRMAGKTPANCK